MIGENFKRFHYSNKKQSNVKVSNDIEKKIRKEINKLRNELDIEYLDLNLSDEYLQTKENKINELIESLY